MNFKPVQTLLYALTLTFSLLQAGFTGGTLDFSWQSIASIFISTVAWIICAILLSYRNRRTKTHFCVRISTHFVGFTLIALGELAVFISMAIHIPSVCNLAPHHNASAPVGGVWCGIQVAATNFGLLGCATAGTAAFLILRYKSRDDLPWDVNVAFLGEAWGRAPKP